MRTYVFVDAENHFIRSVDVLKRITGSPFGAEAFASVKQNIYSPEALFPRGGIEQKRYAFDAQLQLFWDCDVLRLMLTLRDVANGTVARTIYVCSCANDDDSVHQTRIAIRKIGFEPIAIPESKSLRQQRKAELENLAIIEKPKGCDIALASRMVADAAANLYDRCCLFTSDADFLPAIESVRRMGKVVVVGGYLASLPKRSPYLFVPDQFFDLEVPLVAYYKSECRKIDEIIGVFQSRRNV